MNVRRKGVNPYNVKSLKRNAELRELIKHLDNNPGQTIVQVANQFNWSQSKGRSALEILVSGEFAYVSKKENSGFTSKSVVHHYSVKDHTEEDLTLRLPIVCPPEVKLIRYAKPVKAKEAPEPRERMRDPLTELLMGAGRAPSLNFIDSSIGAPDAKPQAAVQAHG